MNQVDPYRGDDTVGTLIAAAASHAAAVIAAALDDPW